MSWGEMEGIRRMFGDVMEQTSGLSERTGKGYMKERKKKNDEEGGKSGYRMTEKKI